MFRLLLIAATVLFAPALAVAQKAPDPAPAAKKPEAAAPAKKPEAKLATAADAKAMLERALAALKADKPKALEAFKKGDKGFRDRDLFVYCANAADGLISATRNAASIGKKLADSKDKAGKEFGAEILKVAAEGKIGEVEYMWPKPGTEAPPVIKVALVGKTAEQVCSVAYYK